jgi:hypothetical protein
MFGAVASDGGLQLQAKRGPTAEPTGEIQYNKSVSKV